VTNSVDWTGLFVLGGVIAAAFLIGLRMGLGWGDLRERVAKLEAWRSAEEKYGDGKT
jgi:hypothetical protein